MVSWWHADLAATGEFTDSSYAEKLTCEFTAPAQGDYLVIVTGGMRTTSGSYSVCVRSQLDDSFDVLESIIEASNVSGYYPFGAMYLAEDLAAGDHYIDVDAYIETGASGYLTNVRIVVVRLDDWLPTSGMYAYTNVNSPLSLSTSWQTAGTLTFTPDQAGDYLILGSIGHQSGNTNNSSIARLNYDSDYEYLPILSTQGSTDTYIAKEPKDNTDQYECLFGGIISLPASEKTILLEAKSTSGGVAYDRRIIAIRLGAMDSGYESDEDVSEVNTNSTTPIDISEISFTPGSTSEYLIIGSVVHLPSTTIGMGKGYVVHTTGTNAETLNDDSWTSKDDSAPADSLAVTSAIIKELGNTSQIFKTQHAVSTTSLYDYARNSWLVAIRKPSSATTAYKDIGFKSSFVSADIFADIAFTSSLRSPDQFKDLGYKTSLLGFNIHSIYFKTSLTAITGYKDIGFKSSLEALDFADLAFISSLISSDQYKDLAFISSFVGLTIHDFAFKTSLTAGETFKDLAFITSLEALGFDDVAFITSLVALGFADLAFKTSLISANTFADIAFTSSLRSPDQFKDLIFISSFRSSDQFKDLGYKTSLLGFSIFDISFKTSLGTSGVSTGYKDLAFKTSLAYPPIIDVSKIQASFSKYPSISADYEKDSNVLVIYEKANEIDVEYEKTGIER